MTENEIEYRKLIGKIGLTMILFLVLSNTLGFIPYFIVAIFEPFLGDMGVSVPEGILNIIVYLA